MYYAFGKWHILPDAVRLGEPVHPWWEIRLEKESRAGLGNFAKFFYFCYLLLGIYLPS